MSTTLQRLLAACLLAAVPTPGWAQNPPPAPPPPHAGPDLVPIEEQVVRHVEQVQLARQQADRARQQAELARAQIVDLDIDLDPPVPPEPPEGPGYWEALEPFLGGSFPFGKTGGTTPLVIHSGAIQDDKVRGMIVEDLNVMHRILTKAASAGNASAGTKTAMGIAVLSSGGKSAPSSIYLEGFGVVFLLNVHYPLTAPPSNDDATPAANPEDTTWEEAKREVYGQRSTRRSGTGMSPELMARYGLASPEPPRLVPYNQARVEALTTALMTAARNVTNIRNLDDEENVVVVVRGTSGGKTTHVVKSQRSSDAEGGAEHDRSARSGSSGVQYSVNAVGYVTSDSAPDSTLTLRFKKADAAALANGGLSLEDFRKRAKIVTY
ncbi:MAG: hypothetical protein ACYC23_15885 [Limisphaerales bacterium]